MTVVLDPEIAAAIAPYADALLDTDPPPLGDWRTRRAGMNETVATTFAAYPPTPRVTTTVHDVVAADGTAIPLRLHRRADTSPGSLVVYIHGGGMIGLSAELYDAWCRLYMEHTGVPLLAPEYRLAPEHRFPVPYEDCYSALIWARDHAGELGVDPARIAVMGDSAGGGIAAAIALMARDRGDVDLCAQLLVYAMLDDRTDSVDPEVAPYLSWRPVDNLTGWRCLLGDLEEAPPLAAPARAQDLSGLPPAFIDVGQLDLFAGEDVRYAARLGEAGVAVELHLRPSATHGFDMSAPNSTVGRRAFADRGRVLTAL